MSAAAPILVMEGDSWCFGRESVVSAIEAVRRGELIVVVDDETRENEGDLIMAAELATKETIAFVVCLPSLAFPLLASRTSRALPLASNAFTRGGEGSCVQDASSCAVHDSL